jgi:hypothetical protein
MLKLGYRSDEIGPPEVGPPVLPFAAGEEYLGSPFEAAGRAAAAAEDAAAADFEAGALVVLCAKKSNSYLILQMQNQGWQRTANQTCRAAAT